MAQLLHYVKTVYKGLIPIDSVCAWSDSEITLYWICSSPHKWKSFVANHVSYIQERIPVSCWRHVGGKVNRADIASRGALPKEFLNAEIWFNGPTFLKTFDSSSPFCIYSFKYDN